MKKIIAASLVALVASGGVALPALASPFGNQSLTAQDRMIGDYPASGYVQALRNNGVNAVQVYEWGDNAIRAEVSLGDGRVVYRYYDVNSLKPLGAPAAAGDTRVLTRIDTGLKARLAPGSTSIANELEH